MWCFVCTRMVQSRSVLCCLAPRASWLAALRSAVSQSRTVGEEIYATRRNKSSALANMKETYPNIKKFIAIMERFPALHFCLHDIHETLLWEEVAAAVRKEIREECSVPEAKRLWRKLRVRYITLYKRVFQGKNLLSEKECDLYDSMVFIFPQTEARHGHSVKSSTQLRLPEKTVRNVTSSDDDDERIPLSKYIQKRKSNLKKKKPIKKNSIRTYDKIKTVPVVSNRFLEEPSNPGKSSKDDIKNQHQLKELNEFNETERFLRSNSIFKNETAPIVNYPSVEEPSDSERSIEEFSFITKTETLVDDPDVSTSFIYKKTKAIPAIDSHSIEKPSDSQMNTEDFGTVIKTESLLNEPEIPTSSTYKKINPTDPAVRNHSVIQLSDSEKYSSVIKTETLWNETDVECSSSYRINIEPNEEKINEKSHAVIESTSLAARETEENLDMQFFKSILPDIADFAPHEKRKFKMGVLKVIDEIAENRNNS